MKTGKEERGDKVTRRTQQPQFTRGEGKDVHKDTKGL